MAQTNIKPVTDVKYRSGNQTIEVYIETSGITLDEFKANPTTAGTFEELCPETANYNLDTETDDRNPLCKLGKVSSITSKTMTVSLEGAFSPMVAADMFLLYNFLNLDGALIMVREKLGVMEGVNTPGGTTPAKPITYVGWYTRTALEFPRSGGETASYTFEGSSGDVFEVKDETEEI